MSAEGHLLYLDQFSRRCEGFQNQSLSDSAGYQDERTVLRCDFEGTSIILHGVPGKQDLDVSFDGHDAEDAFREIPESGSDWNWNLSYDFLVSPPLEDRPHTIEFGQDDSSFQDIPRIDHAYVSPGRNTFLRGRSMMVDDPLLEYRDRWTEYPISSIFPRRQELGFDLPAGTFHACDAPGCTAVLEFFGTSVTVVGWRGSNPPWSPVTRPRMKITIDGKEYFNQKINTSGPRGNFDLFSTTRGKPSLTAGLHTLRVQFSKFQDFLPFVLDYVLYESAFDSLEALEALIGDGATATSTSSPVALSAGGPEPSEEDTKGSSSQLIGTAVGAAIGMTLGAAIILFLVGLIWRRRARQQKKVSMSSVEAPPPSKATSRPPPVPAQTSLAGNATSQPPVSTAADAEGWRREHDIGLVGYGYTSSKNLKLWATNQKYVSAPPPYKGPGNGYPAAKSEKRWLEWLRETEKVETDGDHDAQPKRRFFIQNNSSDVRSNVGLQADSRLG